MADDDFWTWCGCTGCIIFTLGILFGVLPFVFFTTQDTEIAVLYSTIFAEFESETVDTGGFHTKPYAATVFLWPRVETNVDFNSITCNSEDGLLISLKVSFQYFPQTQSLLQLTQDYGSFTEWERIMKIQAESAIRHTCGEFDADSYQSRRGEVAGTMETNVRQFVTDRFQGTVTKLQLQEVRRPAEFEAAVRDKENARSEISLALNEEAQAITQAETKVDVAQEEAIRVLDTATTSAEIRESQAETESLAIRDRFDQLSLVFGGVKDNSNLSVPGILTFISNEIFNNDVTIAVDAPVSLNFKDDL